MFDLKQIKETFINYKFEEMNTQKFTVEVPKGYKAENIQFIDGKICYELVPEKKSIKEIVKNYKSRENKYFYINTFSSIAEVSKGVMNHEDLNALFTHEKCEQILALEQLIMNCWIVNGCKELSREEVKVCIFRDKHTDKLRVENLNIHTFILNFTSLETAQEFYETYKNLIETAKPLL